MILNNLLALLLQFFIPLFQHSLTIYLYINLFTLWIKSTFLIIFKLKVSKNKEIINDNILSTFLNVFIIRKELLLFLFLISLI